MASVSFIGNNVSMIRLPITTGGPLKNNLSRLCNTIAILVGLSCCNPAQSETNVPPVSAQELPAVVITASRTSHDTQSEPAVIHVFNPGSNAVAASARTLPDLLAETPSVMLQKTSYGQGAPFLRGFTGFRTLCLVDGVRLNNSVFRDGPNQYWNTIDPLMIDRAELVLGPGSVLYGSDAIGGTLNALSVVPPEWNGSPIWTPSIFYRGATAERSTIGRVQVAARPDPQFGFVGGYSLKSFGDLIGGKTVGEQPHTGYDERDWDAKLLLAFDDNHSLTLAHQHVSQDDAWRTHKTIYGDTWQKLTHGTDLVHSFDQQRDLSYGRYVASNLEGWVNRVDVIVSRQCQQEDQTTIKSSHASELQGFDVETWGLSVQLTSDTQAGEWVVGGEYYRDGVDSYNRKYRADGSLDSISIQGPVADDASYGTLGFYAQDTLRLLDGRLDLIPGVRYTYTQVDADRVLDPKTKTATKLEDDWNALVGSLRLLYPILDNRTFVAFASVAQGFRSPNLSDLTRLDTARTGEIETPSPGLDPERFLAGEVGLKARWNKLTGQLAYYYTEIDNLILRTPTGSTVNGLNEVTKRNSGKGYIQGVEGQIAYTFTPHWSARACATWMDGKIDGYPYSSAVRERDVVSRLMPPTFQTAVRWQTFEGRFWCEAVACLADKADRLSADDKRDTQRIPPGGTPGYAVYHLRTGAQVTENLRLTLALENLFNEDYRIHGSGVNEPGRNLVLTALATF